MKRSFFFLATIVSAIFMTDTYAQKATTTLKVMVLDNLGAVQEDATVKLFATKEDYEKEVNPVAVLKTNKRGNAEFINLVAKVYYINVVKGDKTNAGNGEVTEKLEDDRLNKMKVIISD